MFAFKCSILTWLSVTLEFIDPTEQINYLSFFLIFCCCLASSMLRSNGPSSSCNELDFSHDCIRRDTRACQLDLIIPICCTQQLYMKSFRCLYVETCTLESDSTLYAGDLLIPLVVSRLDISDCCLNVSM